MVFKREIPLSERFWSHVEKADGCWLWKLAYKRGQFKYGRFSLNRRKTISAHRMAWILTNGSIPDGMCVLHRCDEPRCVRPDHLFLGTQLDNIKDRDAKGRQAMGDRAGYRVHPEAALRGSAHPRTRLTEELVLEIRIGASRGVKWVDMAEKYGVSVSCINHIVARRVWRHV